MPALFPAIAVLLLAEPLLAANPGEIAAARKDADVLIASTTSPALFENITDSEAPAVRHLRSGLVCRFPAGSVSRSLKLHDFAEMAEPGDSLGCRYIDDGKLFSLYAMRLNSPIPARQDLDESLFVMAKDSADARPYRGLTLPIRFVDGDPAGTLTGALILRGDSGDLTFNQVIVGRVGDWNLRLRTGGPLAKDLAIQRQGGEIWSRVMLHIVHRPGRG